MGKDNPGTYSRVLFLGLPGNTDTWGMVSGEVWRQKSPRHQHGSLLSLYILDSYRSPDWIRISDDNPNYSGYWLSKYCYGISMFTWMNFQFFLKLRFMIIVLHPKIHLSSNLFLSLSNLVL